MGQEEEQGAGYWDAEFVATVTGDAYDENGGENKQLTADVNQIVGESSDPAFNEEFTSQLKQAAEEEGDYTPEEVASIDVEGTQSAISATTIDEGEPEPSEGGGSNAGVIIGVVVGVLFCMVVFAIWRFQLL